MTVGANLLTAGRRVRGRRDELDIVKYRKVGRHLNISLHFSFTLRLIGSLEGDGLLLTHGGDDGNADLLTRLESGLDVGSDLTLGDLDVVLGSTVREHQVEETL
jgi:hypothetical protein